MKPRSIIVPAVLLVAVIFFALNFWRQPAKYEFSFFPMGGIPCQIVEYELSSDTASENAKLVEKEVERLENIFSVHREGSEAAKLNTLSAGEWLAVSPDMYRVIGKSVDWAEKSGGAFDITVKPLIDVWKKAGSEKRLPVKSEISEVASRVGSKNLELSSEKGVRFSKDGMSIDFGAIAKGFILDAAGSVLAGKGVGKYLVSCGGDVVMQGKKRFRVGVQEPGGGPNDQMMVLSLPSGAVVTSGHYERFTEIDGKRYSHIIDPVTGWPVDNSLKSVTVWADNGTDADALATAIAVMGLEKSVDFLKGHPEFRAVLLAEKGDEYEIYYSKELGDEIEFVGKWAKVPRNHF